MKRLDYLCSDVGQELFTTQPVVCIHTFGPGGIIYRMHAIHVLSISIDFILLLYNIFFCDAHIIYIFMLFIVFTPCF